MSLEANAPLGSSGANQKSGGGLDNELKAENTTINSSKDQNEDTIHRDDGSDNLNTESRSEITRAATVNDSQSNSAGSNNSENSKSNNHSTSVEIDEKTKYISKRIAKQFRVSSTNKIHERTGGKVNKIFFGTVDILIPGKAELWRILYDDGDVDIMSQSNLADAIQYYEMNKEFDTNHAYKKQSFPVLQENGDKDTANNSADKKRRRQGKTKADPPKRGKKNMGKVARKEALPDWTGPPDEEIDGGWPKGVSMNFSDVKYFLFDYTISL